MANQRMAISIKTTSSCQGQCKHCTAKPWMRANPGFQTGIDDIRRLIDVSLTSGYKWDAIVLSGGEPLEWEHIETAPEMIRRSGIARQVKLFTNALAVTKKRLSWFAQVADTVDEVRISRYFGNEARIRMIQDQLPTKHVSVVDRPYMGVLDKTPASQALPADCTCRSYGMFGSQLDVCAPMRMICRALGRKQEVAPVQLEPGCLDRFSGAEPGHFDTCRYCLSNRKVMDQRKQAPAVCAPIKYEIIDRSAGGGRLHLSNKASIERRASIDTSADVTVGAGTIICEDVVVYTHDHDLNDPFNSKAITRSPLHIGERVWIGARSIILNRVSSIGAGAVVGAGSVVTSDVAPGTMVAGNPAKALS